MPLKVCRLTFSLRQLSQRLLPVTVCCDTPFGRRLFISVCDSIVVYTMARGLFRLEELWNFYAEQYPAWNDFVQTNPGRTALIITLLIWGFTLLCCHLLYLMLQPCIAVFAARRKAAAMSQNASPCIERSPAVAKTDNACDVDSSDSTHKKQL